MAKSIVTTGDYCFTIILLLKEDNKLLGADSYTVNNVNRINKNHNKHDNSS